MNHVTTAQLEASTEHLGQSPSEAGTVELIVRRPEVDQREVLSEGEISTEEGLVGDNWASRGTEPNFEAQLTLMNSRYVHLIAGSKDRWPLAGDQFYVDFDLSVGNLPPGARLAVGDAVVEISATPHTGCAKFKDRFGRDALRFANSEMGSAMRLRGVNARVVRSGAVQTGDVVKKV
jgi:MOSC domain-containing protein YiiM